MTLLGFLLMAVTVGVAFSIRSFTETRAAAEALDDVRFVITRLTKELRRATMLRSSLTPIASRIEFFNTRGDERVIGYDHTHKTVVVQEGSNPQQAQPLIGNVRNFALRLYLANNTPIAVTVAPDDFWQVGRFECTLTLIMPNGTDCDFTFSITPRSNGNIHATH